MIEIELFYKIVEARIRSVHTEYLQRLKRVPLPDNTSKKKRVSFKKLPIEDKLLKGYNKGIETALTVIEKEFKRFDKRLKKEEKDGKKF